MILGKLNLAEGEVSKSEAEQEAGAEQRDRRAKFFQSFHFTKSKSRMRNLLNGPGSI